MTPTRPLPPAARYAPWTRGFYDVAPALRPLGTDFGNGLADTHLIQLDRDFDRYRSNKEAAYADDPAKYFGVCDLPTAVEAVVADRTAATLANDHPSVYEAAERTLTNRLTGETVAWLGNGELDWTACRLRLPCRRLFEAIALQLEPDVALVHRTADGRDRVAAAHVCAPSHWDPVGKLGQSFFQTHTVVPGFERVNAAATRMVDAMIHQGPFVRFVWGVESDDRLNHHPVPPAGEDPAVWNGRRFDRSPFVVRVERQTLLGMPEIDAALFVIHAKTIPGAEARANPHELRSLRDAVCSMSPDARRYKGLDAHWDALMGQLE